MLDQNARELSIQVEGLARGLSQWILDRHLELDPDLPSRMGEDWRKVWRPEVELRLRYLAQALAVQRPEVFATLAAWSREAYSARGMYSGELKTNLIATRDVLTSELPEHVSPSIKACIDAALTVCETNGATPPKEHLETLDPLALRYLERLLEHKGREAVQLLLDAAEGGRKVTDLYENVIVPVQVEIGGMWHREDLDVSDEHFATATTQTAMSRLRQYFPVVEPNGRRVLAACCNGELHDIGLRLITEYLEMAGWEAQMLGANVPVASIHENLVRFPVDLLVLSLGSWMHIRQLGILIASLRDRPEHADLKILVGGSPFVMMPDLAQQLGADGTARSGEEAVRVAGSLAGI